MGSDTDLPIMAEAAKVLRDMEIEYEVRIISAHRTPEEAAEYARTARSRGLEVIIAGAGGAAHLAGSLAACTTIPVLCVPMPTTSLDGLDSLYSIVQMPGGVPVATLAIGRPGAKNAGLLAAQILGLKDEAIRRRVEENRIRMKENVLAKDRRLREIGIEAYLQKKNQEKKR
ncbi:MAG: 5-(carboxyamino)imidazole ribonucleotide mutase [Candidatus Hydrogenedentota bacterium]|nr:MAG: 5-(carboxyamino)imidazole ribonucleotide mutase [Candidatus Hydrogenedentota bacterium]